MGENGFHSRVKRARNRFVVAHGLMPVLLLAAWVAAYAATKNSVFLAFVLVVAVVVTGLVWWAWRQALRPGRWAGAAAWSGGCAGVLVGLPIILMPQVSEAVPNDAVLYAVPVGGWLLGLVVSWWLARRAARLVLEPFDDTVIYSAVAVPFPARGLRGQDLTVTSTEVVWHYGFGSGRWSAKRVLFAAISVLDAMLSDNTNDDEFATRDRTRRRPLASVRGATPSWVDGAPAVELIFDGDERWTFPTDRANDVLRVLRVRAGHRAVERGL